jgi:hypothetical protein
MRLVFTDFFTFRLLKISENQLHQFNLWSKTFRFIVILIFIVELLGFQVAVSFATPFMAWLIGEQADLKGF